MSWHLLIALCFCVFSVGFAAEDDDPCDKKKEAEREALMRQCSLRKLKSEKAWQNLEGAKTAILEALRNSDAKALSPYIGCDAGDTSSTELHCLSHQQIVAEKQIIEMLGKIKRSPTSTLHEVSWVNYGPNKDLHLLCSKGLKTRVPINHCGNDSYQPVIEIKNDRGIYYIYGVPLTAAETK